MKTTLYFSMLLVLCLSVSGCIELTERIHFNKDGSGHATISVKSLTALPAEEASSGNDGVLLFDGSLLMDKVKSLKGMEGISNIDYEIKTSFDTTKNGTSYVSFNFKSVETLDTALMVLYNANQKTKRVKQPDGTFKEGKVISHLVLQKKGSKRIDRTATTFYYLWDAHFSHFSGLFTGNDYPGYMGAPYHISKVKLNYNYSFEYPVNKSQHNTISKISADKKNVTWQVDTAVLIHTPLQVANSFLPAE